MPGMQEFLSEIALYDFLRKSRFVLPDSLNEFP